MITQLLAALCLAAGCQSFAHDGPEHEIEELTDRIVKGGETAHLLIQRAIEYQVVGKAAEAARDLERALEIEADSTAAQRELSRAYFTLGKTNEALKTASQALKTAEGPDHASLLILRAELLRVRKEHRKALDDASQAIGELAGNVDWYLFRSQLQAHLKLTKERVQGLEEGITETGSGVLEAERIDALIENGQSALAIETIETELGSSRLRSSWLIRRGRVRLAAGEQAAAKADLESALAELDRRISAATPDPSLLADRGFAKELLGRKADARKDYELARDKGFSDDWLQDRLDGLKGAGGQ